MKDCGCRNHLGKKKQMHKTYQSAVDMVLKRHLRYGPHRIYPCPRKEGVWHVKSLNRATSGSVVAATPVSGRRRRKST